jgi:hypothetical protein
MSGYFLFGSTAAATNPNYTYEFAGFNSAAAGSTVGDGAGRVITANATTNIKGTGVQLLSSTANAWVGLSIFLTNVSSVSARYLIDISVSGDTWTTPEVANLYLQSNTGGMGQRVDIPLIVPAGSNIYVRCQSSTTAATLNCAIVGWVGSSNAPGYSHCSNLLADTANTRSSTVSVTQNAAGWTTLINSTGQAYGALISTVTQNSIANSQNIAVQLALGAPSTTGDEVEFARYLGTVQTGSPSAARDTSGLLPHAVAATKRISCKIASPTGSDTCYVGLIGFY